MTSARGKRTRVRVVSAPPSSRREPLVDYNVHHRCALAPEEPQPLPDGLDEGGGGHHADLHRVGGDVGKHRVHLLDQKRRGHREDPRDPQKILGR